MEDQSLPPEIVEIINKENCTLHKAWRIYRGHTVAEVAHRVQMFPHRLEQMEASNNPCYRVLVALAGFYKCRVEELID
ncbi:TPA: hypothetical protein NPP60_004917 [Klebsiella variicola subsp. variicola]|nr:hypothetical protein [Klebsiella variicola subsp. variicola]